MLGRYMVGATAARLGGEASGPALVLAALAATGSPGPAAVLLATLTVTAAAGGPVLGAMLDRSPAPGRLLAGALCGHAAGLAALAMLLGRVPEPWLLALAAGTGFFGPALTGGWTSRLAALDLGSAELRRAYAADTASYALAGLAGPGLASVLATGLDGPAAVLAAAVLAASAVPAALAPARAPRIPRRPPAAGGSAPAPTGTTPARRPPTGPAPPGRAAATRASTGGGSPVDPPGASGAPGSAGTATAGHASTRPSPPRQALAGMVTDLRHGGTVLLANPRLRAATVVSSVSYLGFGAATVALPVLGQRLAGAAGAGAALLSVLAAGSLASTAVLSRWAPRVAPDRQVRASVVALAAGLLAVAFAPNLPVAVAGLLVAGLADGPLLAAVLLIRHQETPAGLRAQVLGTAISLKQASYALGAAAAGALAAHSVRAGLLLMVVAQLVALVAGRLTGIDGGKYSGLSAPARSALWHKGWRCRARWPTVPDRGDSQRPGRR